MIKQLQCGHATIFYSCLNGCQGREPSAYTNLYSTVVRCSERVRPYLLMTLQKSVYDFLSIGCATLLPPKFRRTRTMYRLHIRTTTIAVTLDGGGATAQRKFILPASRRSKPCHNFVAVITFPACFIFINQNRLHQYSDLRFSHSLRGPVHVLYWIHASRYNADVCWLVCCHWYMRHANKTDIYRQYARDNISRVHGACMPCSVLYTATIKLRSELTSIKHIYMYMYFVVQPPLYIAASARR